MSKEVKILAFAGSMRKASFNKSMVKAAAAGAEEAGAEVTYIDLRNYPLPLYNGDLEAAEGLPCGARKLKQLFDGHDGLLIASPEYNSSYSAVLKNALDWISRPADHNEPMLNSFVGKQAVLMATSPGALGGLRGLYALRELLMNMMVQVHPNMMALPSAMEEFDEDGSFTNLDREQSVRELGALLVESLSR
ncbi:NADPH-dependent FMN reductase [Emcibacter nanhaiensis]|uniref:NAD(P)H-dependent oxidoreductase n=1 Tax=Emcibacter nanhaiensis TaxID=1505037 RepID=A0A501PNQ1_9PROT|nr:NAD(P)H-dependent oxidoreductase [Emcibacter nanhaiensis]TPD61747.1 NAD(P)H-dependent oxidoreductase [Emcibacter nanhaiensis]